MKYRPVKPSAISSPGPNGPPPLPSVGGLLVAAGEAAGMADDLKRGGRPRLDADEKRTIKVSTWLSPEEYERFDAMRGAVTKGAFVRRAIFSSSGMGMTKYEQKINADLARAMSNLNQIARHANTYHDLPIDEARAALADLIDQCRRGP